MTDYVLGDTIRIDAEIYDWDQTTLIDPDSQEIKIYDVTETLQATITNPTKTGTGKYYVEYTIPEVAPPGTWAYYWKATTGKPSREKGTFEVIT